MKLYVGGCFAGQEQIAKDREKGIDWADGAVCSMQQIFRCGGIYRFQEFIYRQIKEKKDLAGFAERLASENPDIIIVSDEVGYGVVPLDKTEREYREAVGRISAGLAAFAERVSRTVCGIEVVLKDETVSD